jgi:hypothetical protein
MQPGYRELSAICKIFYLSAKRIIMNIQDYKNKHEEIFRPLRNLILKGTTSISKLKMDNTAYAHATGSYIEYKDDIYLISNQHIAQDAIGAILGHVPGPSSNYERFSGLCLAEKYPIDVFLLKLTDQWNSTTKTYFKDKFDEKFQPVDNEYIFWIGYPGTTLSRHDVVTENRIRSVYFDVLDSPAVPFLTTINKEFDFRNIQFEPSHHFAINYPEIGNIGGEIALNELPNPKGLSGSLVWDTKYKKTIDEGKEWSPELARICGIIWADFGKKNVLFATKVEFMLPSIEKMHAKYPEAIEINRNQKRDEITKDR